MQRIFAFLGVDDKFAPGIQVYNATAKENAFNPALRTELLTRYEKDLRQLEKLLGRELMTVWT